MKKTPLKLNQSTVLISKCILCLKNWLNCLIYCSDIDETQNDDIPDQDHDQEIISVSSSPSKDNEAVREESPVAGPSGVTSDSSANERKPITWNESPWRAKNFN